MLQALFKGCKGYHKGLRAFPGLFGAALVPRTRCCAMFLALGVALGEPEMVSSARGGEISAADAAVDQWLRLVPGKSLLAGGLNVMRHVPVLSCNTVDIVDI